MAINSANPKFVSAEKEMWISKSRDLFLVVRNIPINGHGDILYAFSRLLVYAYVWSSLVFHYQLLFGKHITVAKDRRTY